MRKFIPLCFILIQAMNASCQSDLRVSNALPTENFARLLFVAGHRGGFEASLPENSISMFGFTYAKACKKPIALEFDIRESASGNLFIMHDSTVDRTTGGFGKISTLPDSYIETLSLKDRNGVLTTEKVPHFSDVLNFFQDKNAILLLDVKGKIWQKVINLVYQMHMESKCILLTFNPRDTRLMTEIAGKMMISALVSDKLQWESFIALQKPGQQLIAYVGEDTPRELLAVIHNSKVLLMTDMSETAKNNAKHYEPDLYRQFILNRHLDILISDYPLFVNNLFCNP